MAVDQGAAGAGRVWLEAARAERDRHAIGAQGLDTAAERARLARAVLTNGRTTMGMPGPGASARTPGACACIWAALRDRCEGL